MNINSVLIKGSEILRNKLIPSPILDAEILMAKTIKKDRNYILLNSDSVLNKNDLNYFFRLIEQRSLGSPVAYLTNKKFFWLGNSNSSCLNNIYVDCVGENRNLKFISIVSLFYYDSVYIYLFNKMLGQYLVPNLLISPNL